MDAKANPTASEVPRAPTVDEIVRITGDFVQAARNDRSAGFDAVAAEIGAGRLGLRIWPWGTFNDVAEDEIEIWTYLARRDIAYLHLIEPRADNTSDGPLDTDAPNVAAQFRALFPGAIISAGGYTATTACEAISVGRAEAVAFGRPFIANPDLSERIRRGAEHL